SVLKALREQAPQADIAYFGDIKNAPYGLRNPEELRRLALGGIATLKTMRAGELIAACNSVSPSVLENAAERSPLLEMSLPFARSLSSYAGEHMLLLATPATIASKLYERAVNGTVTLDPLPVPDLAGAIEFGASESVLTGIIREALSQKLGEHYEGLILGCTHYPLVRTEIETVAGTYFPEIKIIDPAEAVAREAAERFNTKGVGKLHFRISADSEMFRMRVAKLFPSTQKTIEVG
ncbi:MAG: aspartate/glutamate racemase family protein, partial [Patescibacteria group bacterium]|nr:aspartate/glutamate racemase family protein [Patescibacteria group bacterium]